MTVTYELNPPKVIQDTVLSHQQLQESVNKLKTKAVEVSNVCNSIHVTDSVIGIPRISSITIGVFISNFNDGIELSARVSVRDRNLIYLTHTICDSILFDLNAVLIY